MENDLSDFLRSGTDASQDSGNSTASFLRGDDSALADHAAKLQQNPNFFARVGEDVNNRNTIANEIGKNYNTGNISKPSEILQLAGNSGAGIVNDIGGEALKSIGSEVATHSPEWLKNSASSTTGSILNTDVAKAGIDALKAGGDAWKQFSEQHPNIANNLTAVGNLAGAAPAEKLLESGLQGVNAASKAAIGAVSDTSDILKTGFNARYGEALDNISKPIKQSSSASYKTMRDAGANINADAVQSIVDKMHQDVLDTGLVDPALHPKTISIMSRLRDEAAQGPMSVERLDQYRQLLGDSVSSDTSKIDGMGKDGYKSLQAMKSLDNSIGQLKEKDLTEGGKNAIDALNNGRAQWAQASKIDTITRILKQADGNPNKIKSGFSKLVDSGMQGFTNQEKVLIRQAAANTTNEKLLKMFGKLGIDLGGDRTYGNALIPGMEAATALYTHSPNAAIPLAVGTVAKQGQKYLARGKAEKVLQALENRGAPMAEEAIKPSVPRSPINLSAMDAAGSIAHALPDIPQNQTNPDLSGAINRLQQIPDFQIHSATPASSQPTQLMQSIKKAESGNNPNAKNPNSSAAGPYQFTAQTWKDMVAKHPETKLTMQDRADPAAQEKMMPYLISDNTDDLRPKIGREPSNSEIYMAHVLGPTGAAKLIQASPKTPANTLFPDKVIKANRNIFLDGTRPRTAEEVYRLLANKIETA